MKRTLVVGASPNPDRYAYIATEMLKEYAHEVYPFGIKKGYIGNSIIENEWPSKQIFDTVTLYLNPQMQENFKEKILALKPKRVVFNPGTENPEFEKQLSEAGIEPIEACTLVMLRTNQY